MTEIISVADFLTRPITSANGILLRNIVDRLSQTGNGDIPQCYADLFSDVSKYTSVAGYLQVTCSTPLDHLNQFCNKTLDLRSSENRELCTSMNSEIPALWPLLIQILESEKSKWLPDDVSALVK